MSMVENVGYVNVPSRSEHPTWECPDPPTGRSPSARRALSLMLRGPRNHRPSSGGRSVGRTIGEEASFAVGFPRDTVAIQAAFRPGMPGAGSGQPLIRPRCKIVLSCTRRQKAATLAALFDRIG